MNSSRTLRAVGLLACLLNACGPLDDAFCGDSGCFFSDEEWKRLSSLTGLGKPPPDRSNRYVGVQMAELLGRDFYFDPRFSGRATVVDTLQRPQQYARAARGEPINISCATCHDPARGGSDHTSVPGHVSVGAGWYDVNGQQTLNSAYYDIIYWNARNDSLWAQIVAVNESGVSMNSNRVKNAWTIFDDEVYRETYNAIFTEHLLPFEETSAEYRARLLDDDGIQCRKVGGACPAGCTEDTTFRDPNTNGPTCWPRWPLQGRPGTKAGCTRGDATEPFFDAFDCMAPADQKVITRIFVNWSKAVAAYEYRLISDDSPFDTFMREGADSSTISEEAQRGAKLFVGKASCIDCHNGALFSDNRWHNVGVGQTGPAVPTIEDCVGGSCDCVMGRNCLPNGIHDGLGKLKNNRFRRDSEWSDDREDDSRARFYDLELDESMKGAWRTPSLRDVALTAPYMHNGAYRTLEEVVRHYNSAGATSVGRVVGQVSVRLRPLNLTLEEEADLVAFLKTLNGKPLAAELLRPNRR